MLLKTPRLRRELLFFECKIGLIIIICMNSKYCNPPRAKTKPNISRKNRTFCAFSVRADLEFLRASSQQLIKMYLRRKEEEEEGEEDERTEDGGNHSIQISYKLGYIQVREYISCCLSNLVFTFVQL